MPHMNGAQGTGGSKGLLTVVALAGAGTMVVELAAIRVLAPWFGTSSTVWTNVIGVVLLALAVGYLAGSKLAAKSKPWVHLGACLLFAAALTCWLPAGAGHVAQVFLPAGVTLDRAAGLLVWGSLATSLVLFAPPAVALGCIGPLAMECLQERGVSHAGTAGGRVLFASTLGSLVGTFGTTHLFIPELGLAGTLYLAAGVLGVLGVGVCWVGRRLSLAALCALGISLGALFIPSGGESRLGPDARLLEGALSTYQDLRVVEFGEGPTRSRHLQVNEGFDSYQSVWQPQPGLLPQGYYNYFCPPAWWSNPTGSWDLLVLGLGAGTAWRVMEASLPPGTTLNASGIEIDREVVRLGRRWMDLAEQAPGRRVLAGWDARVGLDHLPGSFDQIVLDTYANQMEIPAHLSSVDFFSAVRDRLVPGGWLTINIGGFGFDDPVVDALANTAAKGFGSQALVVRVPFTRNLMAYLRRDGPLPAVGGVGWRVDSPNIQALLNPVEIEGSWRLFDGTGPVILTDDRNNMEQLQQRSIVKRALQLRRQEEVL